MTQRLQALMIAHGAIVFLVGMAVGFPFAWVVVESVDPTQAAGVAGTARAWHMAHLEGIMNGLLLIAVAAVAPRITLSQVGQQIVAWGLIVTAWGNMIASIVSPLTGGRGLQFTGFDWNSLTFTLFVIAIIGVVAAMGMLALGALRTGKD